MWGEQEMAHGECGQPSGKFSLDIQPTVKPSLPRTHGFIRFIFSSSIIYNNRHLQTTHGPFERGMDK